MMSKNILFIGLGNMGWPMADRLLNQGYSVQGFDLISKAKEDFQKAGGLWREDLKDIETDVVFSMLPGGTQVKQLYLEDQKLLSVLKPGTLIADCSTADPQSVCEVYKEAKKRGLRFLSIPVSGGTKGAKEGTLTFMAGGEQKDLKEIEPLLKIIGKNIFHAGETAAAGQAVKICNNMLLAIHMIGTCEAFALGKALGLEPEILNKIMGFSSGNNWSLEKYNPCPGLMESAPSSRNYEGGFSVQLMLKDLSLAKDSMERTGQMTELGYKAFEIYKKHFEEGYAQKDFSHIFTAFQKD